MEAARARDESPTLDDGQVPDIKRRKLDTDQDANGQSGQADEATSEDELPGPHEEPLDVTKLAVLCPSVHFRHAFPVLSDQQRVYTPAIKDALGVEWRVIWYPQGRMLDGNHVSVFVERVPPIQTDDLPPRCIDVEVRLLHRSDVVERNHHQLSGLHPLTADETEIGVKDLYPREALLDSRNGFITPEWRVQVEVLIHSLALAPPEELPTEPLRPEVDAREETGMVGLKNQGATCYLNSLLQTLFHLRAFRQVVYETPTEKEDTTDSVSLALQRVFYRLQSHHKAVSTKELTRSFGWSQIDSFMQHDVQELYRILCDRLEEKMKNTPVDGAIKRLFEGKVRSFVECVDVDFRSTRDESFYDLQLDVKGCKDLYESFKKYVEVEMLDGDNQYEAEGYGKQDARKGVRFRHFPPVLSLQLKRFEYDPMRDGMVKIHDRFTFPKTLVLDPFVDDERESSTSDNHVYHLHSVLVHSGDVHGGHYYAYIRTDRQLQETSDWFKFDDEQISRADDLTALEGSFGTNQGDQSSTSTPLYSSMLCSPDSTSGVNGDNGLDLHPSTSPAEDVGDESHTDQSMHDTNNLLLPLTRSYASAYMLVYVRDGLNDISSIREQVEKKEQVDVPPTLVNRFLEEEKVHAERKRLQQLEHLFLNLRIATDDSVGHLKRITKSMDFSSFNATNTLKLRLQRTNPIRAVYLRVYLATGVPVRRQRIWRVITRENRTHRPDTMLDREVLDYRLEGLVDEDASAKSPVRLFLQILPDADTRSIYRYSLADFTPPTQPDVEGKSEQEAEQELLKSVEEIEDEPTSIGANDILLFVKFYDLEKRVGERLVYVGNLVFDNRHTGAQLDEYLHEALEIPSSKELVLYEEIQPSSVAPIQLDTTLEQSEMQTGDIVCYQYACTRKDEAYPDVPSYFSYLLDKVDVVFYQLGSTSSLTLSLLYSYTYDEIIHALASSLELDDSQKMHLRLYQHSPLHNMPKKSPLRHSRYAGDTQTKLEHFLTEYSERSHVMHFEMLSAPITEIEAKKQVRVACSIYDDIFVDPTAPTVARRMEFYVLPSDTIKDLMQMIRNQLDVPEDVGLRVCETRDNGTVIHAVLELEEELERYWVHHHTGNYGLFVERVPEEETQTKHANRVDHQGTATSPVEVDASEEDEQTMLIPVAHCSLLDEERSLEMVPHGVPFLVHCRTFETVEQVHKRMQRRMGVSDAVFNEWRLTLLKNNRAYPLPDVLNGMHADRYMQLTMENLQSLIQMTFDDLRGFGLEHSEPHPVPKYNSRRTDGGIRIR